MPFLQSINVLSLSGSEPSPNPGPPFAVDEALASEEKDGEEREVISFNSRASLTSARCTVQLLRR